MTVFVTGGTGYLGRAVVRALLSQRRRVRALVRPQSDTRALSGAKLETVLGDVRDPASLRAAMADCETVVHVAALVDPEAKRGDLVATNVQGLRNVVDAALHHRVRKIVHVSAFFVLGPSQGKVADDAHVCGVRLGASEYEVSKAVADKMTRVFVSDGAPLVVVHPTVVYGPGPVCGGNLLGAFVDDLARGRLSRISLAGEERLNFAYVDDVALGITRALDRAEAGDRLLLGGENLTLAEVLRQVQEANSVLTLGSGGRIARLLRGRCSAATRFALGLLGDDWAYTSERAEKVLGYRSRPFRDGVAAAVGDLLQSGLLATLT
jgi:nucleoside-diphosphate-sugar epimerase